MNTTMVNIYASNSAGLGETTCHLWTISCW